MGRSWDAVTIAELFVVGGLIIACVVIFRFLQKDERDKVAALRAKKEAMGKAG